MNEKEAIARLERLRKEYYDDSDFDEVIEWFQRRVDIMTVAETPFPKWDPENEPYVYRLGKYLQQEAHIELDAFIMWNLGAYQLDEVRHKAKQAQEYLGIAFQTSKE